MNKKTTIALSALLGTGSVLMLVFLVFSVTKAVPECVVSDNLTVKGNINAGDADGDKVKAYEYCDETGTKCFDPSGGWSTGTEIFYESSGYEAGIGAHDYCISKGYVHAITYEYWNGSWGHSEICGGSNDDHFHTNTPLLLPTENPSIKAGQTNTDYYRCGPQGVVYNSWHGNSGGTAYYFKIMCSG